MAYSPHTWTNGIGFAVNLQLFAASGFAEEKELEFPYNPPGWTIEARDGILETPFHHDRGSLRVPDGPGLGFAINAAALKRYGRRYFVMDRPRLAWYSVRTRGLKVSMEIDRVKKRKKKTV